MRSVKTAAAAVLLILACREARADGLQLQYGGTGSALSLFEAGAPSADSITLSLLPADLFRIDLNGATFDAGSIGAAVGLTYEIASDPGASRFVLIDASASGAISQLNLFTGGGNDVLTVLGLPPGTPLFFDGGEGDDTLTSRLFGKDVLLIFDQNTETVVKSVPEPGTLVLAATAILFLLLRRRFS